MVRLPVSGLQQLVPPPAKECLFRLCLPLDLVEGYAKLTIIMLIPRLFQAFFLRIFILCLPVLDAPACLSIQESECPERNLVSKGIFCIIGGDEGVGDIGNLLAVLALSSNLYGVGLVNNQVTGFGVFYQVLVG